MKSLVIAVALTGTAAWLLAGAVAPDPLVATEARILLLDKAGKPADLTDITATLTVTPKEGETKTYPLEVVKPPMMEKPAEKAMAEHMICGEIKSVRDYNVEFVVGTPAEKPMGHEGMRGEEYGIQMKESPEKGFLHHHGGPYFRADVSELFQAGKIVNFTADVSFTKKGDTWAAKGFQYPIGMTTGALGLIQKEFGKLDTLAGAGKWDEIARIARSTQATVEALPALSFKEYSKDAERFDKARNQCLESCRALENGANAKNREQTREAGNKIVESLKELSVTARNSEGARIR